MNTGQTYRVSGGKLAGGILMAVVFGLLSPLITVLEMSLLIPVVLAGGLFMVFLYCFAGRLPVLLFIIVQTVSTAYLLNTTFMWMALVSGTLPAVYVMRGIANRRPFFEQLRRGVILFTCGLVAAIFIAYAAYGGNMIGRLTEALRSEFERLPDELFAPFVESLNSALTSGALPGINLITVDAYRSQVFGILSLLGETYAQTLPGTLFSGAILTGVLAVLWGNWLLARRGLATDESYISPLRWFLPSQAVFGLILIWIISYVLTETGYKAGSTVYIAVYYIIGTAFVTQAVAAIDRFLFRRGRSEGRRRAFIIVTLVFAAVLRFLNTILFAIGAMSALFGSHGAFKTMMNRRNKDRSNGDDPDQ